MTDDMERQLDEFYRKLDPAARRLENEWKPATHRRARPARSAPSPLPWIVGALAASAAIVLIVLASSGTTKPAKDVVKKVEKTQPPPPTPAPDIKPEPKPEPKPDPRPEPKPEVTPEPRPEPKPEPKPEPGPEPKPETPPRETKPEEKPAPPPVEPAMATLPETDGAFELAGRKLKGRQKDVAIRAGDKLKAETVAKLTLADDRFVIVAPRTQIEFAEHKDGLRVSIDSGEILAELVGRGPAIRVSTKALEIDPIGTVYAVRVEGDRTTVSVEEGRVECRSTDATQQLAAGQQAVCVAGKGAIAVSEADPRRLAWTRGHRPAERTLYREDFDAKGVWEAEVADGVAKGVADPSFAAKVRTDPGQPLFLTPVRGRIEVRCRAERAAPLIVQIFVQDRRMNFMFEAQAQRSKEWKTIVVEFDKFVATDKTKRPASLGAAAPISEIYLQYGASGEKINFEVDAITVTEQRP